MIDAHGVTVVEVKEPAPDAGGTIRFRKANRQPAVQLIKGEPLLEVRRAGRMTLRRTQTHGGNALRGMFLGLSGSGHG